MAVQNSPATDGESLSVRDELSKAFNTTEDLPETEDAVEEDEESQYSEPSDGRERDPQGRFKAKEAKEPEEATEEPAEEKPHKWGVPLPKWASTWSPEAKAEFKKLPQSVREALEKREELVTNNFAQARQEREQYQKLDEYVEMARNSGTTLPEVLERYVAAERMLDSNPIEGIKFFCQRYNINPVDVARAMGIQTQAQQAVQQPVQPGQQPAFDPRMLSQYIDPLRQELASIKNQFTAREQQGIEGEIDQFFSDTVNHPYADNVSDQMATLIKSGVCSTLEDAYNTACWRDPNIRSLLIRQQQEQQLAEKKANAKKAASTARAAGRSVSGGPQSTPDNEYTSEDARDMVARLWDQRV